MRFIGTCRAAAVLAVLSTSFLIFCQAVPAQQDKPSDAPKVSKKEGELANKMQEGTDVGAKLKLAEKFIKDFPNSPLREQVARYIAGSISTVADLNQKLAFYDAYAKIFTKAGESDYAAPFQVEAYSKTKRYDEAFRLGGDYLSRFSGDLWLRLHLAIEGSNLARGGNRQYLDQTRAIIGKAIEIIESGTKPAEISDNDWKLAPTVWLAQFYQSLGFVIYSSGKRAEAAATFEKAASLDPKEVNNWAMIADITNQNYQDLAQKYMVASGSEQAELRKKAEAELDKVIELYAHVVGLTDGVPEKANLNTQMRGDLESYYKYRHRNSTDGMQALIDKYKTPK
ncbi:MAG: hypothetical protein JSS81_09930 [Acidobacteria bacterium]|nr:hypothetical protein [Acidobacteriota bacterium]